VDFSFFTPWEISHWFTTISIVPIWQYPVGQEFRTQCRWFLFSKGMPSKSVYTHQSKIELIFFILLIVPLPIIVCFWRSVVYWERVRIYPMNICQPKRFQQTLTPTGMQRSFELIIKLSLFGYFNRIFYLFSYGIVLFELGTGLRAYDSHREHPYLRGQNREQRTQGSTRCESWSSLFDSIPTANVSGLVLCFFKS